MPPKTAESWWRVKPLHRRQDNNKSEAFSGHLKNPGEAFAYLIMERGTEGYLEAVEAERDAAVKIAADVLSKYEAGKVPVYSLVRALQEICCICPEISGRREVDV